MLSTPLGAALATITPQLCRAALVNSSCREVLALPLHPPEHSSQGASLPDGAPQVAFSWAVASRLASSSSTLSAAAAGSPSSAADAFDGSVGSNLSGLGGTASSEGDGAAVPGSSNGGLTVQHSLEVFAALTIEVMRTPGTAGHRGAGSVLVPDAAAAHTQHGVTPHTAAIAAALSSGGAEQQQQQQLQQQQQATGPLHGNHHLQLQAAALVLLAGIACQQLSSQPLLMMLQLVLLGGLAAVAWGSAAANGGSSSSSIGKATAEQAGGQQLQQQQQSAVQGKQESSSSSTEDVTYSGWSMRIVCGDVCSTPSRHLQLQVSLARSSRGMARLRLRMASMSAGGANLPLLAAAQMAAAQGGDEEGGDGLPVLVADPEPAWLSPDTKQR
jgi:hypothetical protein